MDLDRLKSAWQQQDPGPERRLRERAFHTERVIVKRDHMETLAVVLLIPVFAVLAWKVDVPLARFGAVWTICASIYVAARLWLTRRRTPPSDPSLPVREYCDRETERVENQIHLLKTAGVWYVFPLLSGVVLGFAGLSGWNQKTAIYSAAVLAFGVLLTKVNRDAAKTELEPLAARLRQLKSSLSGGPSIQDDPRQQAVSMDQAARSRNRRQAVIAVLGSVIVIAIAWRVPNGLTVPGAALMVLTWTCAVARVYATQRRVPPADPALPDYDFCHRELERVEQQMRLLSTAGYWYFAPLVIGALTLIAGAIGLATAIAPAAVVIMSGIILASANRNEVRIHLQPLAEQLRAWKDSI